jgi:hypothetical protein
VKNLKRSANRRRKQSHTLRNRVLLVGAFAISLLLLPGLGVHAATLSNASVAVGDSRPSAASSNYTFTASNVTTGAPGTIKCIKWQFTDTSTGSTVPAGMSTNGGGVIFDTAGSNYVPTPASWTLGKPANGTLTFTNAAGETPASAAGRKLSVNGITNSNLADTKFWLKFTTYNNTDCATSPVDNANVLFILTNSSQLSLTVDNTLSFTVNPVAAGQTCNGDTATATSTATTIPFGTVTPASNSIVCQDLTAATNATNGYTIYARYTAKPTNALSQTISDWTGSNTTPTTFAAPGTEAYGYTTDDATLGTGVANRFTSGGAKHAAMTTTNSEVAFESVGLTTNTYRVGHEVGVSLVTRPGTYTTTIIYTCTPIY